MTKLLTVNTDGSCKNIKGKQTPMGAGVYITSGEKIIHEIGKYAGMGTNNKAEWEAVMLGAKWLKANVPYDDIEVRFLCDNQMVVRQLTGEYSHRKFDLYFKTVVAIVRELEKRVTTVSVFWIPREQNKEADKLAGDARLKWIADTGWKPDE